MVVVPNDSTAQVSSGVLVDALANGRPIVATAFSHAIELLASGRAWSSSTMTPSRSRARSDRSSRSRDLPARWQPRSDGGRRRSDGRWSPPPIRNSRSESWLNRVRIGLVAALKRQNPGIEDDTVADLDGPGDRRSVVPCLRTRQQRVQVG